MARPSTIDRMPDEIRAFIGKLRRQGRSIDEIRAALAEQTDINVPRSTLGRHTKEIDALAQTLQESQGMAAALLERLDANPEKASATARMNSTLANGIMFKLLMAQQGNEAPLDPKEAKFLMEAHAKLVSSDKAMFETISRAQREWQAEQRRKFDELASTAQAGNGLDLETLDQARRTLGFC